MSHIVDMLHMYPYLVSFGRGDFEVPVGDTRFHIEPAAEAVHVPLCQIQFFVDEAQADTTPVSCIGNTGIEMRETVFPPAYTRFIKKGDTGNE